MAEKKHKVRLLDLTFHKRNIFQSVEKEVQKFSPEIVGFSVTTFNFSLGLSLAKNIKKIDKNIDKTYLNQVNKSYNRFFFHYDRSPLVVVKTTDIDFVNKEEDLENLIHIINNAKKGTHYYSPLGSP